MKYVEGDIFKLAEAGEFEYVIHGCNCQNAMGSGIAKTVRDKYPQAYAADMKTQKGDLDKLGHFTSAYISPPELQPRNPLTGKIENYKNGFTIINAYTQGYFGVGEVQVDYDAIKRVFKGIKLAFDLNGYSKFAIPKIGAVRGGGDWDRIEMIIDSIGFIDLTCVIYNGDVNK